MATRRRGTTGRGAAPPQHDGAAGLPGPAGPRSEAGAPLGTARRGSCPRCRFPLLSPVPGWESFSSGVRSSPSSVSISLPGGPRSAPRATPPAATADRTGARPGPARRAAARLPRSAPLAPGSGRCSTRRSCDRCWRAEAASGAAWRRSQLALGGHLW